MPKFKDFKPEGTPEANEAARKKLSLHLTGKPNATKEAMLEAVDNVWGERRGKNSKSQESTTRPLTVFISSLETGVKRLQEEYASFDSADFKNQEKVNGLFKKIIHAESSRAEWKNLKEKADKEQTRLVETLFWHLAKLRGKLSDNATKDRGER